MERTIRWGILAPGAIAHSFARGLAAANNAKLLAVGSRSKERAAAFASEHSVTRSYGSYKDLVHDEEIDVIYIANPHNYHKDAAILCLQHDKPVLCEKPFTVNAREAREVVAVARKRNIFIMEAMWTRFLPAMQKVREWIDGGRIGEVRMIDATFSFRAQWDPDGRLLNPALAGGALLDVGVYVASFAYWVTRRDPVEITSQAHIGETGVDEQATLLFKYDDGTLAKLACGVRTDTPHTAAVYGTDGWIELPARFWNGTRAILRSGNETEEFEQPHRVNGYEYEADEVGECLRSGRPESSVMPLDETVRIIETLDRVRGQWGMMYPFEQQSDTRGE
jgi:dihydrodiol dehydrogenase / D-xylose 1-dehydrogenase (NADP)